MRLRILGVCALALPVSLLVACGVPGSIGKAAQDKIDAIPSAPVFAQPVSPEVALGIGAVTPALACNAAGQCVAAWKSGVSQISVQRLNTAGELVGGVIAVAAGGASDDLYDGLLSAAMDAQGNFILGWLSRANLGISDPPVTLPTGLVVEGRIQRFDSDGAPMGASSVISHSSKSLSVAMAPDGRYAAAWAAQACSTGYQCLGSIFLQMYDAHGSASGARQLLDSWLFTHNLGDSDPTMIFGKNVELLRAHMDAQGNGLISWDVNTVDSAASSSAVTMRRYGPDGAALGPQVTLASNSKAAQPDGPAYMLSQRYSIASGADGGFTLARRAVNGDLRIQRFAADGTPLYAEKVLLDFLEAADHFHEGDAPAVARSAADNDVVAYEWLYNTLPISDGNENPPQQIHLRAYSPLGDELTPEMQVNASVGIAGEPQIAADAQGRELVLWQSFVGGYSEPPVLARSLAVP